MKSSELPYTEIETFSLEYLKERAKSKPKGYYEDMVSHGKIVGDQLEIHRDALSKLFYKYNGRNPPKVFGPKTSEGPDDFQDFMKENESSPTVVQMSKNFVSAMAEAAKTGFKKVTTQQHSDRMVICNSCKFWDGKARLGMGKCLKCGCTGAKQWLASSKCPIGLWGSLP